MLADPWGDPVRKLCRERAGHRKDGKVIRIHAGMDQILSAAFEYPWLARSGPAANKAAR